MDATTIHMPLKRYFLHPSHYVAPTEDLLVSTILGSCVSVCLYDPVQEKGGINHFMLPHWHGKGTPSHMYGDYSIEQLIQKMSTMGSSTKHLVAKVFGGSSSTKAHPNIGYQNIEMSKQKLSGHGINITAMNLGGERARKIIFNTRTGLVRMKYITYNATIN